MHTDEQISPRRRRAGSAWLLGIAVGVTLLAVAGPASAQTPPPAIDQYVEDPPDAGGVTSGGKPPSSTNLPPAVSSEIDSQAGSDASTLKNVATSSQYGAPQKSLKVKKRAAAGAAADQSRPVRPEELAAAEAQTDISAGDTLSAAAGALQGGDALRIFALLAGLFAITVAALATAGLRLRRRTS